ncbi:PAS domain S-box protein [bacterium]|nr:PAS domain S-box protein [candidate division CSSED10-310 bacterium]
MAESKPVSNGTESGLKSGGTHRTKDLEQIYQNLLDESPHGTIQTDPDGIVVFISRSAIDMLGLNNGRFIGEKLTELLPHEHIQRFYDALNKKNIPKTLTSPATIHLELENERMVDMVLKPTVIRKNGRTVQVFWTMINITRKGSVQRKQAFMSMLFDYMTDAVVITDTQFRIITINRAAENLFGYSSNEIRGMMPSVFLEGVQPLDLYRENIQKCFMADLNWEICLTGRRRDGSTFKCELRVAPIFDKHGVMTYFLGFHRDVSHVWKSEMHLRQSKAMAEVMLAANQNIAILVDTDAKIITLNESTARAMGDTVENLIGKCAYDCFPPDVRKVRYAMGQQAIRTQKIVRFVDRHGGRSFDSIIYPIRNERDEVVQLAIFSNDITEQEQAKENLKRSEEQTRALINATADYAILVDRDGAFLSLNKRTAEILGKPMEELIGKRAFDCFPSPVAENRRTMFEKVLRTREPAYYEEKLADRTLMNSIYPVYDDDGEVISVAIYSTNITSQIEKQRALEESEEKYRNVIENSNDGICIIHNREIRFINSRMQDMLEYSLHDVIGRDFTGFFPPEERPRVERYYREYFHWGRIKFQFESILSHRNGSRIEVEVNVMPLTLQNQEMTLAFVRDITERKQYQAEIMKSQKLESLGILAGGIAHDFNNILTAIQGYVSVLKRRPVDDDSSAAVLETIERVACQAGDLTQQLLIFARGGAPVRRTESIGNLVVDLTEFSLRGSNVKAEFDIRGDLWPVDIDKAQFNQVINNLVINAVQAMPEGGRIQVTAENRLIGPGEIPVLNPGKYIQIQFVDSGHGIPGDIQSKVFDPFFTTKQSGSGLGLTIVYSIIRKHGGHVMLQSDPGEGAAVIMFLPASDAAPVPDDTKPRDIEGGHERILLMDDDAMVRAVVEIMSSDLGYRIDSAQDGSEAIRMYQKAMGDGDPYRIVIMDLTVSGGMGGVEAMRILKGCDPAIRAIVSSGYSNDPVLADYARYGFLDYIAKPYNIKDLASKLRSVIRSDAYN